MDHGRDGVDKKDHDQASGSDDQYTAYLRLLRAKNGKRSDRNKCNAEYFCKQLHFVLIEIKDTFQRAE